MNAVVSVKTVRWLLIILIGVSCVPLFASVALAAPIELEAGGGFLQASIFYEIVSDRSRLIQISLVVVALGCAVMWWYR